MKVTFFCKVDRNALDVVEFYKQDIKILRDLGHSVHIATIFREIEWDSDLIFLWWWTYAAFPVLLSKLLGKKTIITGTFNYRAPKANSDFVRRPFWQKILIYYALKNANANILVSINEYNLMNAELKLQNLFYSPHIVDTVKYIPNSSLTPNTPFILSIIWTGKQNLIRKCLPEIIESAEILKNQNYKIKFVIAGREGDGFEEIKNEIKNRNLDSMINLMGEITEENKIAFLQGCSIYLQPSKYEGFGVAIAEAMACGATVLTSDAGEVKNLVENTGLVLGDCSPNNLAEAIKKLLSDDTLRQSLGIAARNRIVENFSYIRRFNDIKEIIGKIT